MVTRELMKVCSHQVNSAWPSLQGAVSTSQRAVTLCRWGVKAGMVYVWVALAGKTV